ARDLLGETLAAVQVEVHEIVIRVAPVHIAKINHACDVALLQENVIAAEIRMQYHRLERKVLLRKMCLEYFQQRGCSGARESRGDFAFGIGKILTGGELLIFARQENAGGFECM